MIDTCLLCGEPVLDGDDRRSLFDMHGTRRWEHFECAMRRTIGSVAHLNRACACYVPDSDAGDPPGMTRRQAARAAWLAYSRQHPL